VDRLSHGVDHATVAARVTGDDDVFSGLDRHDLLDRLACRAGKLEREIVVAHLGADYELHLSPLFGAQHTASAMLPPACLRIGQPTGVRLPAPGHRLPGPGCVSRCL